MDEKYIIRWENEYFPTFVADMYAVAFNEYLGRVSGLPISNLIFLVKNSKTQTYFSESEIKKGKEWGLDNLPNKEIIKKVVEKTKENNQSNHKLVTELLKTDLTKLSNEELMSLLERYRNSWIAVYGSFCSSQPERTELVEDKINDYLGKRINDKK